MIAAMRLRVTTPDGEFEHVVSDAGVSVGRAADCGLRVDDPAVADRHLRLDKLMDRWNFSDQFSPTGTWLNGWQNHRCEKR